MLNITFIFDDAIHALRKYGSDLAVVPLPAAVYMMQVDAINHYRYALEHYFPLTLNESFLQNSSLGTPYQKWAYFTNEDFGMLSFAVHNLMRYTSRLVHETEFVALRDQEPVDEMKRRSNSYTSPICEIRYRKKSIGVTVHSDHRLSIVAVRTEWSPERVTARSKVGSEPHYFQVTVDADGNEQEQPIELDEFRRITDAIQEEMIDIRDRSRLATLRERGEVEIAGLENRNRVFAEVCNEFYQSRKFAEPYDNLNESYWI